MIKKILWPTDLSANANKALPFVTYQSQKNGAEVHLLYVVKDITDHPPWYGELEGDHAERIRDWEQKQAEQKMAEICQIRLNDCPAYFRKVVIGDPASEILKYIKNENIDLVVMSNHGRGREESEESVYEWAGLGSVSEKVITNSPVPVIAINTSIRKK